MLQAQIKLFPFCIINSSLKNQYPAKRLSRTAKEFFENVIN